MLRCVAVPAHSPSLYRSPGLWSIVAVVVAAWFVHDLIDFSGGSEALRQRLGMAAMPLLILVHALVSVSPFPGEVVAFGNSMLFGFGLGVVSNWSGWMIAAVIEYGLARRTAIDLGIRQTPTWRRPPAWLRAVPLHHPVFLICGRWLPFGAHLVNTTAGVLPVPFWRHVWCSAVSILPVATLVAALGSGAALVRLGF